MVMHNGRRWNGRRLNKLIRRMEKHFGRQVTKTNLLLKVLRFISHGRGLGFTAEEWYELPYYLMQQGHRVGSGCFVEGLLHDVVKIPLRGTLEIVKMLLDAGAKDKDALRAAMYNFRVTEDVVKLLIESTPYSTYKVWEEAVSWGSPLRLEIAKLLLDAGCCDKESLSLLVKYRLGRGATIEIAKMLVEAGMFSTTAADAMLTHRYNLNINVVEILLKAGAYTNKSLQQLSSWISPFSLKTARLLQAAGCNFTEVNSDGWDALTWQATNPASKRVNPALVDLLINAGCKQDLRDCLHISDKIKTRFDTILLEYAIWKGGDGNA